MLQGWISVTRWGHLKDFEPENCAFSSLTYCASKPEESIPKGGLSKQNIVSRTSCSCMPNYTATKYPFYELTKVIQ